MKQKLSSYSGRRQRKQQELADQTQVPYGYPFVASYVTMEDLIRQKPKIEWAEREISSYQLPDALGMLSRMGLFLSKSESPFTRETQSELLRGICPSPLVLAIEGKQLLESDDRRVYFHEAQILTCMKLAVLSCENALSAPRRRDPTRLLNALFAVSGSLASHAQHQVTDDEVLTELFLCSSLTFRGHWRHNLPRWECLLSRIPQRLHGNSGFYDFAAAFARATGIDMPTFRAIAFAAFASFLRVERASIPRGTPHFLRDGWMSQFNLLPRESAVLDLFCATPDKLKNEFLHHYRDSRHPHYYLPFRTYPLVDISGGILCLSLDFLADRLSSGVYHTVLSDILSRTGERDAERHQFHAFRGRVFETYVSDLLLRAYPRSNIFDFDEHRADGLRPRCDFAIVENRRAIVIECKSRLIPVNVRTQGGVQSIWHELDEIVVKACRQLDQTILDIRNGIYRCQGLDDRDIDVYLPVVCTLDYMPTSYPIRDWLAGRLSDGNLLRGDMIGGVQLIDIGTLELLEPHLQAGFSLADLLVEKNRREPERSMLFWNFVNHRLDYRTNEFLQGVLNELDREAVSFFKYRRMEDQKTTP